MKALNYLPEHQYLFADFETRSKVDLRKSGADVYAKDSSTEILCFGFAFDNEPVRLITFGEGLPEEVRRHVERHGTVIAHNAPFELLIWNEVCVKKYGWPPLQVSQTVCTMALSYSLSLPGSLENLATALKLNFQKDMEGHRVMLQLSRPRKVHEDGSVTWWEPSDPKAKEKYAKLFAYCPQDVEAEREAFFKLKQLSPSERALWDLDRKINDRGIRVDVDNVERAIRFVEYQRHALDREMQRITINQVGSCNAHVALADWIRRQGVNITSVCAAQVIDTLKTDKLPKNVKEALTVRQEAAKASTAKLEAMQSRVSPDGRLRGTMQFCGANTGRWAGRGVQVHNFPRPKIEQEKIEEFFRVLPTMGKTLKEIKEFSRQIQKDFGSPLSIVSDCLRGFLMSADGCDLIAVDYAQIEARIVAWLAGEDSVLEVFRNNGPIYELTAAQIFRLTLDKIDKHKRNLGKAARLALGFGGANGALMRQAPAYGVTDLTDEMARFIVHQFRLTNPNIVAYWKELEMRVKEAVQFPGTARVAGKANRAVTFCVKENYLWCRLPSGRLLSYPNPKFEVYLPKKDFGPGVTYETEDALTKKWSKAMLWGGLICENITQATARDILAHGLKKCERAGYPVVMHIHDEIVTEVPEWEGSVEELCGLVTELPDWAAGLPIKAEGWRGKRYRK